jgi:hypothetical protein
LGFARPPIGQKQPALFAFNTLFAFNGVLSLSMGRQKLSRGPLGYWLTAQQVEVCSSRVAMLL